MNFTYENQGSKTYLVYTVQPDDAVDTMSLGMLTNNKITGLAPTLFMQMDTTKYIKYNVSAKISVKQFFDGPVNKKRLLGVFKGIVEAMLSAEDYMIDMNSIVMDLNYIFADVSTCETILVCLPIVEELAPSINLGNFFKNIMFGTQFDLTENCDHVGKIINYLNSTPIFSLLDFKELLESMSNIDITVKSQPVVTSVPKTNVHIDNTHVVTKEELYKQPSVPVEKTIVKKEPVNQERQIKEVMLTPTPQPAENMNKTDGKEISLLYLLRNYNKENAAAYKAQKEAKKDQQTVEEKTVPEKQQAKASKKDKKKSDTPQGFAVPGQASGVGFSIPGQQPSVQQAPIQATAPSGQSQQPSVQRPVQQVAQQTIQPSEGVAGGFQAAVAPQGHSMNFGETTVLGGGGIGETTVLNASMLNQQQTIAPHIIRAKNNEKIMVNKPVFRIGKERSYVDYFIGDNSGISRSHANIITREGKYFVVDTNSTNHTFVNGTIVQSNVEVEITHGDKLRFANEDFEFNIY